jgi:hypothetical protein
MDHQLQKFTNFCLEAQGLALRRHVLHRFLIQVEAAVWGRALKVSTQAVTEHVPGGVQPVVQVVPEQ